MALRTCRLSFLLFTVFLLLYFTAGLCHAQPVLNKINLSYRCNVAELFQPGDYVAGQWQVLPDATLFISPGARCWLKLSAALETGSDEYTILQRSPLVAMHFYDQHGTEIASSTHDGTSHAVIEIGRRVMLKSDRFAEGPVYVRLDSSNPIFPERLVGKGQSTLAAGVITQERILMSTIFTAALLLTSAMFTASFGVALRDLDFGIYAIYTCALGVTLLAWDQVPLPLVGTGYGWIWQMTNPLASAMLCWLAIRFGKFHRHSVVLSNLLIVVMGCNFLLMLWALLAVIGLPIGLPHFDRFAFENWQDLVLDVLIMSGGWRGWRRDEPDGLMLMLSLLPSLISDTVNRIWDPLIAPFLDSSLGYVLPEWLNQTIHFSGSLTWIALPLVFCFALARRSMSLHITLIDERKRLEDRVLHRTHELHIANKELELLATTDALTGLANRRSMMDWIKREIERTERADPGSKPLALCMLDVDHFKKINDTCGHLTGDRAIVAIAKACSETIRKSDIASRFGGEEFVVLMAETDVAEAQVVAERLRAGVEAVSIMSDSGEPVRMTVSIGVAFFDHQVADDSMLKLLNRADRALYVAKHAGRNQVVLG